MSDKASTVRVQPYTKELINKHAKRLGISQNDLIYKAILSAEKNDFEDENLLEKTLKNQLDRVFGFLKTQDKNLVQVEKNILGSMKLYDNVDRMAVLKFFYQKTNEEITKYAKEKYRSKPETGINFIKSFKELFEEVYLKLIDDFDDIEIFKNQVKVYPGEK
tara:strand:- start:6762 stop:7247 length:486 start_codon:yes stop_codon:yes gene_type:complete